MRIKAADFHFLRYVVKFSVYSIVVETPLHSRLVHLVAINESDIEATDFPFIEL